MPNKKDFFQKYDKLTPDQRELYLISENNYPNQWNSIYDNYRRKVKSGKYDYEKSIKGYLNLVTPARRKAQKEIFYKEGGWSFKPSDDKKVAEVLALRFYEDNLDDIKKIQKENKTDTPKIKTKIYELDGKKYKTRSEWAEAKIDKKQDQEMKLNNPIGFAKNEQLRKISRRTTSKAKRRF